MFKRKGFTLVEVLLVIVVIGILAAIVIPRVTYTSLKAKEEACKANIAAINAQAELWNLNQGSFPSDDLSNIFGSKDYFPDGTVECPVGTDNGHSANYTLDSTSHRVIVTNQHD